MMTMLRHILTMFFFNLLLVAVICTVVFIIYPLPAITDLYTITILNIPFILFLLLITFVFSLITGISFYQFWKMRLQELKRQLTNITLGQSLNLNNHYKEIVPLEQLLEQIERKIVEQIEYIQQLATKRTQERERSLQEVVIQERSRLARDLHDSVSQQLFAASMMMSAIHETSSELNASQRLQIEQVEKMIQQAQIEMRALLLHLRPVQLKGKPLQEGINDLLVELNNRLPIELSFKTESFPIEKGVEDQLFRIVQEALSNALRHAEANVIEVLLIQRDHLIIMRILDDGKGFDMETINTGSYGLENMQERAKELGGKCTVVSLLNKGTKVEVQVPVVDGGRLKQ